MQLGSIPQVANSVSPHAGLPGGVGRDLDDHSGLHLGEPDPVTALSVNL